jgi:hypothetical protein
MADMAGKLWNAKVINLNVSLGVLSHVIPLFTPSTVKLVK